MIVSKSILKEISFYKKKFILLVFITAITTGLIIGFKYLNKSIINGLNKHYNKINLYDIKLESTIGFLQNDKESIKSISGVKHVNLVKTLNGNITINNKDFNIEINSINKEKNGINKLILKSGSLPNFINEGLIEESFSINNNLNIGDIITISLDNNENLKAKKIKIVGIIKDVNTDNNKIPFLYIKEDNFNLKYYNQIFITFKNNNYDTFSKEYNNYISSCIPLINNVVSNNVINYYKDEINNKNTKITKLKLYLEKLYNTDLPDETLTETIKEVTTELNKTQKELSKIKPSGISITKRNEIISFLKTKEKINKIDNSSKIFFIFSILITLLLNIIIIVKILDRKKDEFKLLEIIGYNKLISIFKIILYCFLFSLLGSIIGSLFFSKLIILLIANLINLNCLLPFNNFVCIKFSLFYSLIVISLSIVIFLIRNNKINIIFLNIRRFYDKNVKNLIFKCQC